MQRVYPWFGWNPHQIRQVLNNLVINAYQAMPEGGKLSVVAQKLEGEVEISVSDTGTGIAAEHMQKIFEPLFTTKARGIGLGLAISKKLVEANSGSFIVESEGLAGKGTTFRVLLPIFEDFIGSSQALYTPEPHTM